MSLDHNRIKVADLEKNQPNKILITNIEGELEFSDLDNLELDFQQVTDNGNTTTNTININTIGTAVNITSLEGDGIQVDVDSGNAINGVTTDGTGGYFSSTYGEGIKAYSSDATAGYFVSSKGNGIEVNLSNGNTNNIAQFSHNTSIVAKVDYQGNTTAKSFIKTGGTSSQFLKADGSLDSNTYATTASVASGYVTLDTTQVITAPKVWDLTPEYSGDVISVRKDGNDKFRVSDLGAITVDVDSGVETNPLYITHNGTGETASFFANNNDITVNAQNSGSGDAGYFYSNSGKALIMESFDNSAFTASSNADSGFTASIESVSSSNGLNIVVNDAKALIAESNGSDDTVSIKNLGSGRALFVEGSGTDYALEVYTPNGIGAAISSDTGNGLYVNSNNGTAGNFYGDKGILINSNNGEGLEVNTSDSTVILANATGTGNNGIEVSGSTYGVAFQANSSKGSVRLLDGDSIILEAHDGTTYVNLVELNPTQISLRAQNLSSSTQSEFRIDKNGNIDLDVSGVAYYNGEEIATVANLTDFSKKETIRTWVTPYEEDISTVVYPLIVVTEALEVKTAMLAIIVPPTGRTLVAILRKNGTNITGTMTIPVNGKLSNKVSINTSFVAGDVIDVLVQFVGSATPGQSLQAKLTVEIQD